MSKYKSKKLLPKEPPPSSGSILPKPIKVEPKAVLAEFKQGNARLSSLNLIPDSKADAPKVSGMTCTAAWKVDNNEAKVANFLEVGEKLGNVKVLYHGTHAANVAAIAQEGLRPGREACMFGAGIYVGPIEKAINYSGGYKANYLFKVEVVLGRIKECFQAEKQSLGRLQEEGYDSVGARAGRTTGWNGTLRHSENVVYSPDQVLVLKVYEYQRTEEWNTAPPRPTSGACAILTENLGVLTPANRAFKDVVTKTACGKTGYTHMKTSEDVDIWICNDCIQKMKLKIGSRVDIYKNLGWRGSRITNVRIVGEAA